MKQNSESLPLFSFPLFFIARFFWVQQNRLRVFVCLTNCGRKGDVEIRVGEGAEGTPEPKGVVVQRLLIA